MVPTTVKRAVDSGIAVVPQLRGAKKPLIAWKRYQEEAPTLTRVERWGEKYPDAVWAMVCGEISGYIVLDFDDLKTFERFNLVPLVRTPSGGCHVWVKHPGWPVVGGSRVEPTQLPGLDIRSEGHLATFAGKGYKITGKKIYRLSELPTELRQLIESRKRTEIANTDVTLPADFTDYVSRNELLEEALGKVSAGGGRNEIGFWLACQLRDERYSFEDAWKVMKRFATRVSSVNGRHPYTSQEAYNSLTQAYGQPARLPRSLEDRSLFNRVFKTEWAREQVRTTLRSLKLGTFTLDAYVGHPEEDEPLVWTLKDLQPEGSNVLLSGQRKVGKTSLGLNLARSLLDGKLFLGRFPAKELDGCVGYLNYEMSLRQFNTWLRRVRIENIEQFVHWPLRGKHVDWFNDDVFHYMVEQLKSFEVEYLIVDPWARAISGLVDENDNSQVAAFLERLDMAKQAAGIPDLTILAHASKAKVAEGEERARGASRLEDWADVLWVATRDGTTRFMSAEGRDVDVEEFMISYESDSGLFEYGGGSRSTERVERGAQEVIAVVRSNPGCGYNELYESLTMDKNARAAAIRMARERGWVKVKEEGRRKRHYVSERS